MKNKLVVLAAMSALAVGFSACSQDPDTTPADDPAPATTSAPAETTGTETTGAETPGAETSPGATNDPSAEQQPGDAGERNESAKRAIATAAAEVDGTAYAIDDENRDNNWEVDVMVADKSVEVLVSGDGNTVESQRDDDLDREDRERIEGATVTIEQAMDTALAEVPGTLDDIEIDEEDGTVVWQVSIETDDRTDVDVYVNAADGSVLKVDR